MVRAVSLTGMIRRVSVGDGRFGLVFGYMQYDHSNLECESPV